MKTTNDPKKILAFETKNSLKPEARETVVKILNQSLADLSDLYSQTKQAHWNIRGPLFISLHKLFDDLAETVEKHIDPVAERVTSLGGTALGTVRQAAANSALEEFPTENRAETAYLSALIDRFSQCANDVRAAIDGTGDAGDALSSDLLTQIGRDLDQALWFLEAHRRE